MELTPLTALSPLDGRYRNQLAGLSAYFSEQALQRYRVWVEVEYLLALSERKLPRLPQFSEAQTEALRRLYRQFSEDDARRIKEIERIINHDVKAVEYYLKEKLRDDLAISEEQTEFVHFGLTSQDVNNTAMPMLLRDALQQHLQPALQALCRQLEEAATAWQRQPMLARTHGQPASPTTLGKEVNVFVERIWRQLQQLEALRLATKFGGATGNFNAHVVAFPQVDWPHFADQLVTERLGRGLYRSQTTTQVEHYDNLAELCDLLRRMGVILIDLCRDLWQYISLGYFRQLPREGEVGSSAMPHKINPIDFENAEGNLGVANALWEHFSHKLPISRLQRDLTDSTVLRNLGVPFAHLSLAVAALSRGLAKLQPDPDALNADLDAHWEVLAEAYQTLLRREGFPLPYETLKALTRTGRPLSRQDMHAFVNSLDVPPELKAQLLALSPHTYTGTAAGLTG